MLSDPLAGGGYKIPSRGLSTCLAAVFNEGKRANRKRTRAKTKTSKSALTIGSGEKAR